MFLIFFHNFLPLLIDDLNSSEDFKNLSKNLENKSYKSICIFVDNSGFDIILGKHYHLV